MKNDYVFGTLCIVGLLTVFGLLGWLSVYLLKDTRDSGNKIRHTELIKQAVINHKGCKIKITDKKHNESIGYFSSADVKACGKIYKYKYICKTDHLNGGTIECKWKRKDNVKRY